MEIDYVKERLIEWADFFGRLQISIGYPPLSIEGRLMRDGGVLPRSTKSPHDPMPSNPKAEEIEALWKELHTELPKTAKAIKAKYFAPHYATRTEIARKMKVSIRVFQKRVKAGEEWFLVELSEKKNIWCENTQKYAGEYAKAA
jgi:hypothetical protein